MERTTDMPEVAKAIIEAECEESLTYEDILRMYNLN